MVAARALYVFFVLVVLLIAPLSEAANRERGDGFPKIAKRQTRPSKTQTNSGCTTTCNCGFDCRIQSSKDRCESAPAANCKFLASDCENCASCVCF